MQILSYIVFGAALIGILAFVSPALGDLALRAVGLAAVLFAAWELRK